MSAANIMRTVAEPTPMAGTRDITSPSELLIPEPVQKIFEFIYFNQSFISFTKLLIVVYLLTEIVTLSTKTNDTFILKRDLKITNVEDKSQIYYQRVQKVNKIKVLNKMK